MSSVDRMTVRSAVSDVPSASGRDVPAVRRTRRKPDHVAWRSRIVGHGEAAPAELVPNERNWRRHPPSQQKALAGALTEVGWVQQVVVNRTSGRLVDGHLRVELALARGEPAVPVTYVELSEDEERVVLATLDPLAAMADADATKLAELLRDLAPGSLTTPDRTVPTRAAAARPWAMQSGRPIPR